MKIAVPAEVKVHEYRVAITPVGANELVRQGHEVFVQAGAGEGSSMPDSAYAEAGADCLYAPWISSHEHVAAIVTAVAPKPVNLLVNKPFITLAEATALGVRRISVGGMLAKTAWRGVLAAATEIAEQGTFSAFADLPDLNTLLDS